MLIQGDSAGGVSSLKALGWVGSVVASAGAQALLTAVGTTLGLTDHLLQHKQRAQALISKIEAKMSQGNGVVKGGASPPLHCG